MTNIRAENGCSLLPVGSFDAACYSDASADGFGVYAVVLQSSLFFLYGAVGRFCKERLLN